jgi:tetratricopeptide (TPR) repeat protein
LERGNVEAAKEWYQKALDTWQDPVRKDPVRHISYALNGLGFIALKEKRYEDARQFFTEGIQSAEEFGRVDELARGHLGLASVYFETGTDLKTALTLINESLESFQQQGMQYEIQKAKALQEEIIKVDPQVLTS